MVNVYVIIASLVLNVKWKIYVVIITVQVMVIVKHLLENVNVTCVIQENFVKLKTNVVM